MTGNIIEDICEVIADCEAVQRSGESRYSKEQEKIIAYNKIKEIIYGDKEVEE